MGSITWYYFWGIHGTTWKHVSALCPKANPPVIRDGETGRRGAHWHRVTFTLVLRDFLALKIGKGENEKKVEKEMLIISTYNKETAHNAIPTAIKVHANWKNNELLSQSKYWIWIPSLNTRAVVPYLFTCFSEKIVELVI